MKHRIAVVFVAVVLLVSACGRTAAPSDSGPSPTDLRSSAASTTTSATEAPSSPREPELLGDDQFWSIIDDSLNASGGSAEDQATALEEILAQLPPAQIASFEESFTSKKRDLYTWELWGAAYVVNGGCSDDCFDYFRNWVVGQGRDYYEAARQNPRSLDSSRLSSMVDSFDAEMLSYAGEDAYQRSSGGRSLYVDYEMGLSTTPDGEPSGTPWDEEEVDSLYPELTTLP